MEQEQYCEVGLGLGRFLQQKMAIGKYRNQSKLICWEHPILAILNSIAQALIKSIYLLAITQYRLKFSKIIFKNNKC